LYAQFEPGKWEGSDVWDALVTDVHTDVPELMVGDPGCVLHQAVGNVNMAFIAVDCGAERPKMYAGPVLSHFEFETPPTTRKTDSQWKSELQEGKTPPSPPWTASFLAPGSYKLQ
jgi:hypothetical protein